MSKKLKNIKVVLFIVTEVKINSDHTGIGLGIKTMSIQSTSSSWLWQHRYAAIFIPVQVEALVTKGTFSITLFEIFTRCLSNKIKA